MTRTFIVGCKCRRCRARGRHHVGYGFIVRNAQRRLRRKFRQLIRKGEFDDVPRLSYGRPG